MVLSVVAGEGETCNGKDLYKALGERVKLGIEGGAIAYSKGRRYLPEGYRRR